ncbi:MAG: PAS domain S-box protein [Planctomycetales bacterium]|nr:PAS domain S-box protein [Planctomycetales bacterium]
MPDRRNRHQSPGTTGRLGPTGPPARSTSHAAPEGDENSIQRIDASPEPPLPRTNQPSVVVGIGASAGGLEALERFFDNMPATSGMAFVVVQHLSPDFKSLMDELLARHTKMSIHLAENDMQVESDSVYLLPPKLDIRIRDGRLTLSARDSSHGLNMPIDTFFESLAEDFGSQAVAIIMSGSGSDGSRGAAAVHRVGGLVIVQQPSTAKFDSMPRAALDAGAANFTLAPEFMFETLLRHAKQPFPASTQPVVNLPGIAGAGKLADVFTLLLNRYGIDFTQYRRATISRRIDRRIQFCGAVDLDEYLLRLVDDGAELNSLYKDLLIGVTQFFRDSEAFEYLHRELRTRVLELTGSHHELRIWDAGCATGEEAYSLAILISEILAEVANAPNVKIFATDVHRDSLDVASAGYYVHDAVQEVPPEWLDRYFTQQGDSWKIKPELRRMVVFAPHNIAKDAPFTKIDLVVCRNLLIYLEPTVQQMVMSTFHFALNVGGLLMLGPSESVAGLEQEFESLNGRWRLFQKRRDVQLPIEMRLPVPTAGQLCVPGNNRMLVPLATGPSPQLLKAYDALLEQTIPASILVNEQFEIAHVFGDVKRILHPPNGRATNDVLMMVDGDLRVALSAGLQRASKEDRVITYDAVPLPQGILVDHLDNTSQGRNPNDAESNGTRSVVDMARLTVKPIRVRRPDTKYFLISLETRIAAAHNDNDVDDTFNLAHNSVERIATLESELTYTRESLRTTVEELQTSNEELQATNEELVASNEELQSTNEELHSVNEELHTVNSEYQKKINELTQLTADMDNLLLSTEVGVIYLDLELRVRKFTPSVSEFVNLMPQDVGRPVAHISGRIRFEEIQESAQRVLESGQHCEHEVQGANAPYVMRILPYHDQAGRVQGIVLAFIEIGELKQAQAELQATSERFQTLFELAPCGFVKVDHDGTIVMINAATLDMFGYERGELVGLPVETLVPREQQHAHVDFRSDYLKNPIPRRMGSERHVVGLRKDGSTFPAEVGLTSIQTPEGIRVLAWILDISERKQLEDRKDRLLEVAFAATARFQDGSEEAEAGLMARLSLPHEWRSDHPFEAAINNFARLSRIAIGAHHAIVCYLPDGDCHAPLSAESVSSKYSIRNRRDLPTTFEIIQSLMSERRQPLCFTSSDLLADPRWQDLGTHALHDDRHSLMQGFIAVPLFDGDADCLGFVLLSDKCEGEFSTDDVSLLTQLVQLMTPTFALQFANENVNLLVDKRTAELKVANDALARSNSELEQFAYVASHDLQEPLRTIVSYLQLLGEGQAEKFNDEGRHFMSVAIDGASRLQLLIRDLLAFSRITTRGKPLGCIDANAAFLDALANLEVAIQERNAVISADPLPSVLAEHGQLTVLFQNLIGNGIKYCDHHTPVVHVGARESGGKFEFFVRDNGIGFEPEYCEAVFEIFRRLHNRREYSGTGIGLAICKRIVERCGGEIRVDSTPGAGSTFYFTLLTPQSSVGNDGSN